MLRAGLRDESSLVRQQAAASLGKTGQAEAAAGPPAPPRRTPTRRCASWPCAPSDRSAAWRRCPVCCPSSRAPSARSCASRPSRRWARCGPRRRCAPSRRCCATPIATCAAPPRRPSARSATRSRRPRCSWRWRTSTGACAAARPPPSAASAAPRPCPGLLARLEDEDHTVRRAAVAALGDLRDPRAARPLLRALGDPGLQSTAAEALRRLGPAVLERGAAGLSGGLPRGPEAARGPRGAPRRSRRGRLLLTALADDSADVRAEAALALGDGEHREALRALMDLKASDPSPDVRKAAAQSLKKLAPHGLRPLARLLRSVPWFPSVPTV